MRELDNDISDNDESEHEDGAGPKGTILFSISSRL